MKNSRYLLVGYVGRFNPDYDKILTFGGISCIVSSLHDNELFSNRRRVLPHYHILLEFPKPVDRDYVVAISNLLQLKFIRAVPGANISTIKKLYDLDGGCYVQEARKSL